MFLLEDMAQASGPAVANRAGEMPGSRRPLGLARPFQARAAARPGVWQVCSWPGPGLVPGPRPGSGSGPAWPLAARPPALPGCWGILEHNLGAARFCVFITYTTHNTHITQESRDHQRRSALRGRESEEEEQRGSSSVRRKMKQRAEAIALAAGLKLSNEQCTCVDGDICECAQVVKGSKKRAAMEELMAVNDVGVYLFDT